MLNSTMIAQTVQKPFIMFETNTASCGGFKGVSNSFGSALWGLDYGLQMVFSNFTHAFIHVGGQSVYYNVRAFFILYKSDIDARDRHSPSRVSLAQSLISSTYP